MKYSVQFPTPKTAYRGALELNDVQIGFEEDDEIVALVIESLSAILHCSPDQIGRGGQKGAPITINVTRTVFECAMRVAVSEAAALARQKARRPGDGRPEAMNS